jgi:hypothetical protein
MGVVFWECRQEYTRLAKNINRALGRARSRANQMGQITVNGRGEREKQVQDSRTRRHEISISSLCDGGREGACSWWSVVGPSNSGADDR